MSLFFVIGTTIELAIVLLIKRTRQYNGDYNHFNKNKNGCPKNIMEQQPLRPKKSTSFETYIRYSDHDLGNEQMKQYSRKKSYSTTDKIDFAALIVFLSLFLLFNCAYFLIYM